MYTDVSVSTRDIDPADDYGTLSITEVRPDDALDCNYYPAVVILDTAEGVADFALTGDQLLAVRDALTMIIRNQGH